MTIRAMTREDCVKAADLERMIFSQPWTEQGFYDALDIEQNIFLVAEEEGIVCGYIGMYQALDEGEITNVAVAPEWRKRGVGRRLMQAAMEKAGQQGIVQIVLEVRVSNAEAIRLYEKCGFINCGIRKGFYDFPKEDACIMVYRKKEIIYCNKCGRPICVEDDVEKADYLKIEKNWGYFSGKDGMNHKINICEKCYDEMIEAFQIPPLMEENTELL